MNVKSLGADTNYLVGILQSLSRREKQVVELVAQGYTNESIAVRLSIKEVTVVQMLVRVYSYLSIDLDRNKRVMLSLAWNTYVYTS